jgi:hypothetical protein
MVHKLIVDTCVWLDLAKDYRQQPVITALQDLMVAGEVDLLVPEIVLEEFARNKDRVIADAQRSLQAHFRMVRDAVGRFGDDSTKAATLKALNEVDHAAIMKGEAVNESIERIERLIRSSRKLPTTKAIKERVTERALAQRAPYHRSRNSVGDAILVETYAGLVERGKDWNLAFVTHNTKDFSGEAGDKRNPHADLADLFSPPKSTYWVSMVDFVKEVDPELLEDHDSEFNFYIEPRRLSEIMEAEHLLYRQVWYNRHMNLRLNVQQGKVEVTPEKDYARKPYRPDQILDSVWAMALAAAKRTEDEVGVENLGPWDDFEWGMLNGKLSALRWVMGDEWDMLDT